MKLAKIGREERKRQHWGATILYRLGQGLQHLGLVAALNAADCAEVERWLPPSAMALFYTLSRADQQHSLRVCRELQAEGYMEQDLLAAALLHDVGKAQGRVPFWTRPVIVLGKLLTPHWLRKSIVQPETLATDRIIYWRRALSYAWWHAEIGAELAAQAGVSAQAVLYIRTHHQPEGPAAVLHRVDEVS
jgi:hypothetical protein